MAYEKEAKITNKLGLHVRPAATIARTAEQFKSEIWLMKDDLQINAKSIMGVMTLAAETGSVVKIKAEGEDEKEAVEALVKLIGNKFGEE